MQRAVAATCDGRGPSQFGLADTLFLGACLFSASLMIAVAMSLLPTCDRSYGHHPGKSGCKYGVGRGQSRYRYNVLEVTIAYYSSEDEY